MSKLYVHFIKALSSLKLHILKWILLVEITSIVAKGGMEIDRLKTSWLRNIV